MAMEEKAFRYNYLYKHHIDYLNILYSSLFKVQVIAVERQIILLWIDEYSRISYKIVDNNGEPHHTLNHINSIVMQIVKDMVEPKRPSEVDDLLDVNNDVDEEINANMAQLYIMNNVVESCGPEIPSTPEEANCKFGEWLDIVENTLIKEYNKDDEKIN